MGFAQGTSPGQFGLGRPSDFTQGTLKSDLEAVIKSAGVDDATLESTLEGDLNAVATAMNISATDVSTIDADLKSITADSGSNATGKTATTPIVDMQQRQLLGLLTGGAQARPFTAPGNGGFGLPMAAGSLGGSGQQGNPTGSALPEMLMAGVRGNARGGAAGMSLPMSPFRGQSGI
jgi:hypothetical protein